jgi:manganese-dependent inorganic pyrophosphatase
MFASKSSLEGISIEDIIGMDKKDYEMGKYKVGLANWETTSPESVSKKKDEIMQALKKMKESEQLDYLFFTVVDILKQNCQLYIIGEAEKEIAEKVFGKESKNGEIFLEGVSSRKKQIIPPLMEKLNK